MKRISVLMIAAGLVGAVSAVAMAAHSVSSRNGSTSYRCARCHVPHGAGKILADVPGSGSVEATDADMKGVPLWSTERNKDGLAYTYNLYSSDKFNLLVKDIGQPDGASKMCLGCHDGSANPYTGSANVGTARRVFTNNNATPTFDSKGNVSTNNSLTRSHPISFTYSSALAQANPGLKDPGALSGLNGGTGTIAMDMLDANGKVQCTSCHNVHAQGIGADMLKVEYTPGSTDGNLCRICHNK